MQQEDEAHLRYDPNLHQRRDPKETLQNLEWKTLHFPTSNVVIALWGFIALILLTHVMMKMAEEEGDKGGKKAVTKTILNLSEKCCLR